VARRVDGALGAAAGAVIAVGTFAGSRRGSGRARRRLDGPRAVDARRRAAARRAGGAVGWCSSAATRIRSPWWCGLSVLPVVVVAHGLRGAREAA